MMIARKAIVVLFCFALAAARAGVPDGNVEQLVKQLDDDRFRLRQDAESKLKNMGPGVLPSLKQALDANPSLEAHRRLERIVHHYVELNWHVKQADALNEARATGKPILVFSTIGTVGEATNLPTLAMLRKTFGDWELACQLKKDYVLLWHNRFPIRLGNGRPFVAPRTNIYTPEQVNAVKSEEGKGTLAVYISNAEGKVFAYLPGFHAPASMRRHLLKTRKQIASGKEPTPAPKVEAVQAGQQQAPRQAAFLRLHPLSPVGRQLVLVLKEITFSSYGC